MANAAPVKPYFGMRTKFKTIFKAFAENELKRIILLLPTTDNIWPEYPIIELNKAGERIYDQWEYEREDKGNNLFALSSALTYWSTHDSNEFPVRQRKGEKNCLGVLAERQKFVGALLKEAPFAC